MKNHFLLLAAFMITLAGCGSCAGDAEHTKRTADLEAPKDTTTQKPIEPENDFPTEDEATAAALKTFNAFKEALNERDMNKLSSITSFPYTFECYPDKRKGEEVASEANWPELFDQLFTKEIIKKFNQIPDSLVFDYNKFSSSWRGKGFIVTLHFTEPKTQVDYTYMYWFEYQEKQRDFLLGHLYCNRPG